MLQSYVRGKGYVPYDQTQLSFVDEVKLTNAEGWKINVNYENTKSWSLCLPKFDTARVGMKENRYFLRTKYFRVLECINQLVDPVAHHIFTNRERLGVTKTEEEIKTMLTKDLFVARTLHCNVFMDADTHKQMDLTTLKSRFRVKCYVKPVVYIRNDQIYIDLEIARATIFTNIVRQNEVKSTKKPMGTVTLLSV